jgi:DNA-binding MarR family transcriptional regulator
MLSKAGLDILDALHSGRDATTQELVAETGLSRRQVTRVVDDFLKEGLLGESRQQHNQRVLHVTNDPVVEAYRRLTAELGHVEWSDLLSPATIRVCWYLDEPRRAATIADRLGVTRQAVHRTIGPLKNRAMLAPAGPEYALADDVAPLVEFAQAVVTHEHRTHVRSLAPSATIEWCDPKRALVRPHDSEDTEVLQDATEWEMTGLAKFREFDLQFFLADEPAFWYAPDDVTPAEVVCHTLVLGDGPRRVSYAMLLIETLEIERETLVETAEWYGLESLISEMHRLIEDGFDGTDDRDGLLPSAEEYAALKDQYEVA